MVWFPPEGRVATGAYFTSTGRKGRGAGSDVHTFPLEGREPSLCDFIFYEMFLLQNFASQMPPAIYGA